MHALLTTLLLSGVCHRRPQTCIMFSSQLPDEAKVDRPCRLKQLSTALIESVKVALPGISDWVLKTNYNSPFDDENTRAHTESTEFVEENDGSAYNYDESPTSEDCRKFTKPQGLLNLHSVCYQNCIIQSLLHCTKFGRFSQGFDRIPTELRKLRRQLDYSNGPFDAISFRRSMGHPWDSTTRKGGSAVLFLQSIIDRAPGWKKATQIVFDSGCWLKRRSNILWVIPREGDNLCGLLMKRNLRIEEAPEVMIIGLAKISSSSSRALLAGKFQRMMIPCPLTLKVTTGDGIVTMYELRATLEEYKGVHVFAHVQCTKDKVWYVANDEDVQVLADEEQVVTPCTFLLFYESRP